MKKTIPFKKDITFKTSIAEVTSISLEHTLNKQENNVVGNFIVSGDYKVTDTSNTTLEFYHDLPFNIELDEKYDLSNATLDVNDFFYEIINDNTLQVNIEVLIDKLEEVIPIPVEIDTKPQDLFDDMTRDTIEVEAQKEKVEKEVIVSQTVTPKEEIKKVEKTDKKEVSSLFMGLDDSKETFMSYRVYIVREDDTLESILDKYSLNKEDLEAYNDLKEIKIGDKLIIPAINAKD